MWYSLGKKIIQFRVQALSLLLLITVFMAWKTSQIQISYDSNKAVPEDNPKNIEYQKFVKQFGADNNLVVIGIESKDFFKQDVFEKAFELHKHLENTSAVKSVMSIPEAVTLVKDTVKNRLVSQTIFTRFSSQSVLDSEVAVFKSLPIYKSLLYNPEKDCYLFAVTVDKDTAMSKSRTRLINDIVKMVNIFERETNIKAHISGLPYIKTKVSDRI